jgi:hypothetical protein
MSMQAESLEILEKASVAPALARAIVRAIEIEIAGAKDTLATKNDLLALRHDMRQELTLLRAEMGVLAKRDEVVELGAQLRAEMGKLGGELHAEIHRAVSGSTRQMYLALLGQMGVMLGFFYFFLLQLR